MSKELEMTKPQTPKEAFLKRLAGATAILPSRTRVFCLASHIIAHEAVQRRRAYLVDSEAGIDPVSQETEDYICFSYRPRMSIKEGRRRLARIFRRRTSGRSDWWERITNKIEAYDLH
jgi:hypothetical protein